MKSPTLLLSILLCLVITHIRAQSTIAASGSDGIGSQGSVSYSVGQIAYTALSSSEATLLQGVQQPYEISEVLGVIDNPAITLATAYPNPATNALTLDIGNLPVEMLGWTIYDLTGKTLYTDKITIQISTLNFEGLTAGIYFLALSKGAQTLKTFKILKN